MCSVFNQLFMQARISVHALISARAQTHKQAQSCVRTNYTKTYPQEVTLLAQLKHPYIIQMLDGFIDENMLIIIFEWAPAGKLWLRVK